MSINNKQKELNKARNNCDFYHHGVCVVIDIKKRIPCFCLGSVINEIENVTV